MTSSNATRLRLTGKLIKGQRHYLLQCDDETIWRLELLDVDVPEGADEVIVEGLKSGIDSIDVDWVGPKHVR